MSTRSQIGIANENGTIESVYCHFDGHLDHVGKVLLQHYNTEEAVREIISMGSISSLDLTIGEPHGMDDRPDDQCTFYARDRGEKLIVNKHKDDEVYLAHARKAWADYIYLFRDGQWVYMTPRLPWLLLTERACGVY